MNHVSMSRFRGIAAVRADANDPVALVTGIKTAFEAFKAENDKQIADIRKGMGDVVQAEKVERINTTITEMQSALDQTNAQLAALKLNGTGGGDNDPARAEHAKAFNQFFRKGADANLRDLEVKAKLTTQSDPDGGYVVPTQMESAIDRVLGTMSAMRSIATVRPIGAASYKKLVNVGGATSGWVGENSGRPETATPRLIGLEFGMKELYAQPAATQTMLDDSSMNIEQWLADEVSVEFAEQEGAAHISGNGVDEPRGLLSYDKVANAGYAWGKLGFVTSGKADGFAASNPSDAFLDLIYALKRGYRQNASWLMNDATVGKIRKFKDGQGNYLWQPSALAGEPASFMGYPVVDDDNMPDVAADAFPIAFGDFKRGYLILDRIGVRVLRDPFTSKPNILFYTTKRTGGGVQNFEAMKLMKVSA
ncbi:phage major capsid protein [Azospirillum picis]|uniref:HK97 family phage major capsid protein n=1 Tax=Azospirillum picis TaxID=488438 RepID=A0ABU0MUY9_9PROT|nr:phage major capsid protein [Azospirillum picis]MBP2303428.1 HK97 family phage major capsid protein [Azospirillum picis]MDQ0537313.1 HK97 family phage major capsid protein [Azospirillum picis]